MGLQLQLSATLTSGPATQTDNPFPGGVKTIPIQLNPPQKPFNVDVGNVIQVNSPSSFVAVAGIGVAGIVTQVLTFYARVSTQVKLQMTFADPDGGADLVAVVPLGGEMLAEFPSNGYLKLLSVKGSGTLEFYAAGNQ